MIAQKYKRKRILFLAPRFPFPADTGGKIRTWNILKQLAGYADIHLVCFSFDREDINHIRELEDQGIFVSLVGGQDSSSKEKVSNVLFNKNPHSIIKYHTRDMENFVDRLIGTFAFDAVHVDHLHMTHYRKCFNGIPCVVDEHNVEFKILERCAKVETKYWKKLVYESQAKKMLNFEASKVKEFSKCLAVSEDDKKLLKLLTNDQADVDVVANGVDTEYFQSNLKQGKPNGEEDAVVFTGSLDWLPNDDAAVFFCKEVLPKIWQKHNELKFYIVGKNPSAQIQDFAKNDNRVIVTGRVEDVRPYIDRSKVFVVPIRVGGGTRLKILEAMAMNKPVVSTRVGAEGIAYSEGSNIIIADDPTEFANQVLSLISDQERRSQFGKEARELVKVKYDWNVIGEKLRKIYDGIIS